MRAATGGAGKGAGATLDPAEPTDELSFNLGILNRRGSASSESADLFGLGSAASTSAGSDDRIWGMFVEFEGAFDMLAPSDAVEEAEENKEPEGPVEESKRMVSDEKL